MLRVILNFAGRFVCRPESFLCLSNVVLLHWFRRQNVKFDFPTLTGSGMSQSPAVLVRSDSMIFTSYDNHNAHM